jgi:gas vesicle protein
MSITSVLDNLGDLKNGATEFLQNNINTIAAGAGGVALGATVGSITALTVSKSKSSKKRKSKSRTVRKRSRRHKKHRYARTSGKAKDRSHKRIRMTKHGQPYVILASGKARFISKKSARNSRRRKGGRY